MFFEYCVDLLLTQANRLFNNRPLIIKNIIHLRSFLQASYNKNSIVDRSDPD